jgi:hypothetical protein
MKWITRERVKVDRVACPWLIKKLVDAELAKIVRGADTADKDLTPYSRGLEAVAEGFRSLRNDDDEINAKEWVVYDALYEFCEKQVGAGAGSQ